MGGIGVAGAWQGGQLEAMRAAFGEPHHLIARAAGFGIERVTITGHAELTEAEIVAAAGIDSHLSLAFVDPAAIRARLLELPLVKDATIRKLYPGDLVVELTERDAFALWQQDGEVKVVSGDGTPIDALRDARFSALPLVVGEGANLRAREFAGLMAGAPDIGPRVRAGMLIAGRRWNLKLLNGVLVKLPEHEPEAAMARLSALQREHRLLERDVIAIDFREGDRIAVRLSADSAEERREAAKKKMGKWKGSDA